MSRLPFQILCGDAGNITPLADASVDAVVTDPPYGIDMAGWDHGLPPTRVWAEVRRVTRDGGILMAFGGARKWHRLACAIEDAGWSILADSAIWLYGTGFPKGKGCLRPAWEPIIIARNGGSGRLCIDEAKVEGRWPVNVMVDDLVAEDLGKRAHYFYVAKPSVKEKEAGLAEAGLPEVAVTTLVTRLKHDAPRMRRNTHPTVKPIALMRHLVRLVGPPGSTILDPFCGSGTTGIAALMENRYFIGIDKEPEYTTIANARLMHWISKKEGE